MSCNCFLASVCTNIEFCADIRCTNTTDHLCHECEGDHGDATGEAAYENLGISCERTWIIKITCSLPCTTRYINTSKRSTWEICVSASACVCQLLQLSALGWRDSATQECAMRVFHLATVPLTLMGRTAWIVSTCTASGLACILAKAGDDCTWDLCDSYY